MIKMAWDPSLSIGIEPIDSQHQRIVAYINELSAAHDVKDRDRVSVVISELVDYTKTHFCFEEQLMEASGYPLTEAHKKVHESFVLRLSSLTERHQNGEDVTRKLMSELQIWLTNHIKREDNDYAPFAENQLNGKQGWVKRMTRKLFG